MSHIKVILFGVIVCLFEMNDRKFWCYRIMINMTIEQFKQVLARMRGKFLATMRELVPRRERIFCENEQILCL